MSKHTFVYNIEITTFQLTNLFLKHTNINWNVRQRVERMNPGNEANKKKTQNIFGQLEVLRLSLLKLLLLIKLFIVHCGFLVLLVLAHKVVHVGFGLSELHLVHALAGVPVEECLAPEHDSELLPDPLEEILDGQVVLALLRKLRTQ